MNEIKVTIQIEIEPDLTKHVKKTRALKHDLVTRDPIEKGSEAYKLSFRLDRHLYAGYVSPVTYQSLIERVNN